MTVTVIHFEAPLLRRHATVGWPSVPRLGESVDLEQDTEGGNYPDGFRGVVSSVTWWADGTVRVVLNPASCL